MFWWTYWTCLINVLSQTVYMNLFVNKVIHVLQLNMNYWEESEFWILSRTRTIFISYILKEIHLDQKKKTFHKNQRVKKKNYSYEFPKWTHEYTSLRNISIFKIMQLKCTTILQAKYYVHMDKALLNWTYVSNICMYTLFSVRTLSKNNRFFLYIFEIKEYKILIQTKGLQNISIQNIIARLFQQHFLLIHMALSKGRF